MIAIGPEAAEALAAIHAAAFDQPWSAAEIARLVANPTAFALATPADAPQGFVMAWAVAEDAEILTLAVAPEARCAGLGAALVEAAMDAARERDAKAMILDVAEDNAAARALYAKLGYEQIACRPGYYRRASGAVNALVLRRALT